MRFTYFCNDENYCCRPHIMMWNFITSIRTFIPWKCNFSPKSSQWPTVKLGGRVSFCAQTKSAGVLSLRLSFSLLLCPSFCISNPRHRWNLRWAAFSLSLSLSSHHHLPLRTKVIQPGRALLKLNFRHQAPRLFFIFDRDFPAKASILYAQKR